MFGVFRETELMFDCRATRMHLSIDVLESKTKLRERSVFHDFCEGAELPRRGTSL